MKHLGGLIKRLPEPSEMLTLSWNTFLSRLFNDKPAQAWVAQEGVP